MSGVCIFGDNIAPVFSGTVVGGSELQMALLAHALRGQGISVTVVDPVMTCPNFISDGIVVQAPPGWHGGVRGIRFLTHRIPGVLKTLRESGASVYYAQGYSFLYLFLIIQARLRGGKFILQIASDLDLLGFLERYRSFYRRATVWQWIATILPNQLTYWAVLHWADVILVQHSGQAQLLQRPTVQVNNIVPDALLSIPLVQDRHNVVVVGTLSTQKGLVEALPVIRSLPGVKFDFVGGPVGNSGEEIRRALAELPNVRLHGQLGREETLKRIGSAKALLNVSPREGFPNTFLEAWALGTPVVSLCVDPGGVIQSHKLGIVCDGNWTLLSQVLRDDTCAADPERLRQYVREYHSEESVSRVFRAAAGM